MNIIVSYHEAIDAIRRFHNLPTTAVITIGKKKHADKAKDFDIYKDIPDFIQHAEAAVRRNFLHIIENLPHTKIVSIKELRGLTGMGLKESKDAVENWNIYGSILHRENRWPIVTGRATVNGFSVTQFK